MSPDAGANAGRDHGPAPDGTTDLGQDAAPRVGWAISFGDSGTDGIWKIVVDPSGNLVVAGFFTETVSFGSTKLTAASGGSSFVGKLDKQGQWLWAVSVDGLPTWISQHFDGLAVDASGNVYYAGEFTGSAAFGATTLTSKGAEDLFVLKLDPGGKVLWAVTAGGKGADIADADVELDMGLDADVDLDADFDDSPDC